jgi:hypothetical protein
MKARDRWKQIQAVLGTAQDGIPGPKDEAALTLLKQQAKSNFDLDTPQPTTLTGRGITLHIEGEDLVIKNGRVTCFGGTNDPQDSGDTASGISTKPPHTMGCALPRNYTGAHTPTRNALQGSPIPEKLPWKTPVQFTDLKTGKTLTVPLIDLGPNLLTTTNVGDLTVAAAKHFYPSATATNFEMFADIRIIGGAKYL